MQARIYCRVSTSEQAEDGFSVPAQRRACRQFCRSQDWDITDEYLDEGFSAKDTDRPALKRLLADVGKEEVVVVWRLDRLTRSVLNLHELMNHLEGKGTLFRSVTEPYDTTTAIGRLFVTLVAALAQWERENLGERVREGMSEMVRQGKWHGGPRPYGYRPEQGKLVLDPSEGSVARGIFDAYLGGKGLVTIADELNARGLRTKDGSMWQPFTLSYILRNPVYTGRIGFNKVTTRGAKKTRTPENIVVSEPVHEAVITDDMFERTQKLLHHRKTNHVNTRGSIYPLTGILYCGKCGGRMNGRRYADHRAKSPRLRYYYGCQDRFRLRSCDMPLLRQGRVEKAFLDQLRTLADPAALKAMAAAKDGGPDGDTLAAMQREMRQIVRRKARWYDAYESGAIGVDDLRERTAALVLREAEIQKSLGVTERPTRARKPEEMAAILRSAPDLWEAMEPTERKAWAHGIFSRVTAHEDGTVDVEVV